MNKKIICIVIVSMFLLINTSFIASSVNVKFLNSEIKNADDGKKILSSLDFVTLDFLLN